MARCIFQKWPRTEPPFYCSKGPKNIDDVHRKEAGCTAGSTTRSRRLGCSFSSTSTHWRERKRSRPNSTERNTASFSTSCIGGRAGPRRGPPMVRARRPRRTGPRSTRGQPGLRGAQPTLATSSSARVDESRRYKIQVALDLRRRPAHFCSSSSLVRMNPLRRAGRYQSNTER
jgi:hypothetical protein